MRTPLSPTVMISGRFNVIALVNILGLIASVVVLTFTATTSFAMVSAPAKKTADGSNLRQIGQASLIYAMDHADQLPRATDVWDYAAFLAKDAGLTPSTMWQSKQDPFYDPTGSRSILSASGSLNPDFRKVVLAVAIPINANLSNSFPATTPVAWTRGLRPDGTWSSDSPYEGDGGYIFFLGGNVSFFKNLGTKSSGELINFQTGAPTNNILEALPPGASISEYVPTAAERRAYDEKALWRARLPVLIAAILWLNIVVIGLCLWIKKILKPAPILITAIIVTIVTAAFCTVIL